MPLYARQLADGVAQTALRRSEQSDDLTGGRCWTLRRVLIGLVLGLPLAVGAGLLSAQLYNVKF